MLRSFFTYQQTYRDHVVYRREWWDDWLQLTARYRDPTLCRDLFELGHTAAWALREGR